MSWPVSVGLLADAKGVATVRVRGLTDADQSESRPIKRMRGCGHAGQVQLRLPQGLGEVAHVISPIALEDARHQPARRGGGHFPMTRQNRASACIEERICEALKCATAKTTAPRRSGTARSHRRGRQDQGRLGLAMQFTRKKAVRCKIDDAILVERLCAQTVLTRV